MSEKSPGVDGDFWADTPERVQHILRAAAHLFAAKGFGQSSMRDIAAESGLSKATLYHYFADKDAILRPLVIGTIRAMFERVARLDDPAAPAAERLLVFMRESAGFFEEFRWAWMASSDAFWSDPEARQRRERLAWRDRYEQHLRAILTAGVESGEFGPCNVTLAGLLVLGALNWLPRWFQPDGPLRAAEIAEQFHTIVVRGLQAGG